jgi:phosphatidylethanolamine-binding protein (PEBP) family uncharacterized protein
MFAALLLAAACGGQSIQQPAAGTPTVVGTTFALASAAFAANQPIPRRYTCDGENSSPPLA